MHFKLSFHLNVSMTCAGVALGAGSETPGDVGTVRSWDSHANYKHHLPGSSPTHSIFSGVIMYCDETHLKSGTGIIRLLLVVSTRHDSPTQLRTRAEYTRIFRIRFRLKILKLGTVFGLLYYIKQHILNI